MFRGRISTNAAALMGGVPVTPTVEYLVVAGGVGGNGGYNVYKWTSSGTVTF